MADPQDILVSNLKDALNQLQRHMVFGLGSSLFLVTLAATGSGGAARDVRVPGEFIPVPIPLSAAVSVVVAAFWIAGLLATITVSRANAIVDLLRASPAVLGAALTYPSIPTTKVHGPRIGLAILPAVFVVIAAILMSFEFDSAKNVFVMTLLLLPNIVLTVQLRTAIGGQRPDEKGD
jgi:hypothetical protein